jgi:tryptophan 7-halogenase
MNICIVGGGTAGWITLSYIAANIDCDITIIHSDEKDIIGVGESTTPALKYIADAIGVPESVWMSESDATFKYGVEFLNFNKKGSRWFHTFDDFIPEESFNRPLSDNGKFIFDKNKPSSVEYFLNLKKQNVKKYNKAHGPFEYLTEKKLSPFNKEMQSNLSKIPGYAYHVDAYKFSQTLRKNTLKHKYNEIIDTVISKKIQDGNIKEVKLKSGKIIKADLFFDCTGFERCLIKDVSKWESYTDLINDRGVFGTVKTKNFKPATVANAQDSGWIWEIPGSKKIGTGYIYSSKHCTPSKAKQTLKDYWNKKGHIVDIKKDVHFNAGLNEKVSYKNIITNGLSQSFIEPLEATSIMITCITVKIFVDIYKKNNSWGEKQSIIHNKFLRKVIKTTKDFVKYHYTLSDRNDTPYWVEVSGDKKAVNNCCDKIQDLFFKKTINIDSWLNAFNWTSMILGYNKKYTKNKRILNANEMKNYKLYVKTLKQHYKRLTKNNLTIKEYLEKINE